MNIASKSENSRHAITTSGSPITSRPIAPGMKSIGAKAATVVSTPNTTGIAMPCAPRIAPSSLVAERRCSV